MRGIFDGIMRWSCPSCLYDNLTSVTRTDESETIKCQRCQSEFDVFIEFETISKRRTRKRT